MVAVDAVLYQQFPVRLDRVLVAAVEHSHADLGLVGDQVEVLRGTSEILAQIADLRIEADENKSTIGIDACRRGKVGPVEVGRIGVFARYGDQPAPGREAPAVVEAGEESGIPRRLPTQHPTAM